MRVSVTESRDQPSHLQPSFFTQSDSNPTVYVIGKDFCKILEFLCSLLLNVATLNPNFLT